MNISFRMRHQALTSLKRTHVDPVNTPDDSIRVPIDSVTMRLVDSASFYVVLDLPEGSPERLLIMRTGHKDVALPMRRVAAQKLNVNFIVVGVVG